MTDPVLRGGRIIDPASECDETADIVFGDGKVTGIGHGLPASGAEIVDVRGLRLLDARECVRVITANRDLIAGVKVRVRRNPGGASRIAPLDIALEVAEETGLPVMAHLDNPPPSRLEVLTRRRRGTS